MKQVNGLWFPDADKFMASQTAPDGTYQIKHLEAALNHCAAFGLAVDGGAHVGTWSLKLAERFTRVMAFEPAADTYECLALNVQDYANVETVNAALGDWRGRASLTLEGDKVNTDRENTGARRIAAGDSFPVMLLDDLHLDTLDFLKLDVEGYEPSALRGARETLSRCKPVVLFEDKGHHIRFGGKPGDCQRILSDLGAKFRQAVGRDQIWAWD